MKMTKRLLALACCLSIVAVCILSLNPSAALAEKKKKAIVLRYAEMAPPAGTRSEIIKWWNGELEKLTNGQVKVEVYWSQSLLKGKEIISGVGSGVADMGWCSPQYNPTDLPLWTVVSAVPFANTTSKKIYDALWEMYEQDPVLQKELEKKNLVLISMFPYEFYTLFTREKAVTSVADIKGLKLRVSSDSHAKAVKAAGGTPVFIPGGDLYTAVQKGTIDGFFYPLERTVAYKIPEIVKYGADVKLIGITAFLVMNRNMWNRLPKDVQKVLKETGRQISDTLVALNDENHGKNIKKAEAMKDFKMNQFPDSEVEKWANLPEVKNLKAGWVKDKESKGMPGKKILDEFLTKIQ
jgi:TRAP-type transport system periplasmic protein